MICKANHADGQWPPLRYRTAGDSINWNLKDVFYFCISKSGVHVMFGNGIDNIMAVDHLLKGKRLGLVTNHTGVSLELRSTSQIL